MAIKTFRDLDVYRKAFDVAVGISKLTRRFPAIEQVELARQLRRSARSVVANIAEGWAKRNSAAEFKRFLQMAFGSAQETITWLDMSRAEEYITADEHTKWTEAYGIIGIMLHRLWKKWQTWPRCDAGTNLKASAGKTSRLRDVATS